VTAHDLNDLLRFLKHSPTFETWQTVISYAIDGQFDDLLERLGGIETFVETTIVNAVSPLATRLSLEAALDNVIASWQPNLPASYGSIERTLRLIASRTPPSGFVKVLGQLTDWKRFQVSGGSSLRELNYLDELAMSALRNYFLVSPAEPSAFPAFASYVSLLWDRLDVNGLRGHACQRLLELGLIGLRDRRIDELLKSYPEELVPSLLSWLLSSKRPERQHFISHIYLSTRSTPDSADIFRTAIARRGARLIEESRSAHLVLRSQETMELWVELEDFELTTLSREWEVEAERARVGIEGLLSSEVL
jgi:hypothetical protein